MIYNSIDKDRILYVAYLLMYLLIYIFHIHIYFTFFKSILCIKSVVNYIGSLKQSLKENKNIILRKRFSKLSAIQSFNTHIALFSRDSNTTWILHSKVENTFPLIIACFAVFLSID